MLFLQGPVEVFYLLFNAKSGTSYDFSGLFDNYLLWLGCFSLGISLLMLATLLDKQLHFFNKKQLLVLGMIVPITKIAFQCPLNIPLYQVLFGAFSICIILMGEITLARETANNY